MKKIYGLDLRSVAGFRIILAVFIALEFGCMVLGNFADIYSPETGILGNGYAKEYLAAYKNFRGIFFIDSDMGMKLFVWLIIITMLLLAAGFYVRLTAAVGCVLLYLFFNRYSVLYFGWEMYVSVMLFWLVLLPSDKKFSIFKSTNPTYADSGSEWRSPLAFALIFQVGFIYFYNGISKNGDLWMSGRALDSFLSETDKVTRAGIWLKESSGSTITTLLTYATLIIEIVLLMLLFSLWKNRKLRYIASFLIFFLHWSIAVFADVGNFKYVAAAVAVLLLPGDFWDFFTRFFSKSMFQKSKKIQLPSLVKLPFHIPEKPVAIALCVIIVFSNLSQTNASTTTDRMKVFIQAANLNKVFKSVNHHMLPQYSFFTQYWHLYSPDPPNEKGYLNVEVISSDNDTLPVYNGVPLSENQVHSHLQRSFFNMLLLRKGKNQKEKIAEKHLQLREIRLWNKHSGNPKMKSIQLVIYSNPYNKNKGEKAHFERIVYKTIDIKYR